MSPSSCSDPAEPAVQAPFDLHVDAVLIERARRHDRRAQEQLYRSFERPMFALLRRMTACPDTAADLLHDSFLHAFEHLHQYRGEAPFGRWLRSIAASRALMHLRAGRRFLELFVPHSEAADRVGVEDLPSHDLERLLGLVPDVPRAVLWLYHVEGYSHQEIAALAGKTVSFSKSQLSRAHQRLRALVLDTASTPQTPASDAFMEMSL
jgi:RNA polymerase sigma-70 factor (ECF subfamily)